MGYLNISIHISVDTYWVINTCTLYVHRCKMHVLGALVRKKYHMYIPQVNIPLPSAQFALVPSPYYDMWLEVHRRCWVSVFCVSTYSMLHAILCACLSVNERPIGNFLLSIQDSSCEKHCGEDQHGHQHPALDDPENQLGRRQVRAVITNIIAC